MADRLHGPRPLALSGRTRGRIWQKAIGRGELDDHRARYQVISTRLFAGRTIIHVLHDGSPGDGFEPVSGGLEDVYFSTLDASRRAAA